MSVSPFLRVNGVAARYGCSTWTVHERTRANSIPHRKLAGGSSPCLFVLADLERWENGMPLEVVELPSGGRIVRPHG
jgi:hypothetical protein